MGKYSYGKPTVSTKDQSTARTMWRAGMITLVLLIPIIVYIVVTTLPPDPVTGKTIDKGVFDPYTTVRTDWFSFRVEKTWQTVPELTKEGKLYTYREMQGSNPQGLLQIYINSEPTGTESAFSRVLPVSIKDGHSLITKELAPDCTTTAASKAVNNFQASQAGVSFLCWAGSPQLYIVAGHEGGDIHLPMYHGDSPTRYVLTYRNLAFSESDTSFGKVLDTFKSL